ncbi:tyrosinase family protein [Streptomyces sp. NBC_01565]|uniref:tyrosinase family protein n=1 Tax=Streptomyces sp. NBC_01565 TaxID=2975881 RepID=UPI00224DD7AC|nr:tyrosinase family protein [Streptomyces sp. NBC_01565]MCX4547162.1 tyrosinase family protein [Streptomyces sp. NBC_01565]
MTRLMDRRAALKLGVWGAAGTGLAAWGLSGTARAATVTVRPEVRTLTLAQWRRFVKAVHTLHDQGDYDRLVQLHLDNVIAAYGVPAFLPWNRAFLSRFEKLLQKIEKQVVLPYWDWSRDSQAPHNSSVLSPSYFGGTGRKADGVVVGGSFANWPCTVGHRGPLRRSGEPTIEPFYNRPLLNNVVQTSRTYTELRERLEGSPNGLVHVNIGGDMGTMHSPNDPLFWVHRAFIDLLWAQWQQRSPRNADDYGGEGADRDDVLPGLGMTVKDALHTAGLGYTYKPW